MMIRQVPFPLSAQQWTLVWTRVEVIGWHRLSDVLWHGEVIGEACLACTVDARKLPGAVQQCRPVRSAADSEFIFGSCGGRDELISVIVQNIQERLPALSLAGSGVARLLTSRSKACAFSSRPPTFAQG